MKEKKTKDGMHMRSSEFEETMRRALQASPLPKHYKATGPRKKTQGKGNS